MDGYISAPCDFKRIEGNSVDFQKTFDLHGENNDETLNYYLRKAGLTNDISDFTAEERRLLIHDIIKSNKLPGYWTPSEKVMSTIRKTRPAPPPPPGPIRFNNPGLVSRSQSSDSSFSDTKSSTPGTPPSNYAPMNPSTSSGSLKSLESNYTILPNRFAPAAGPAPPPPTPPSPSSFVTSVKGSRYEISGPINFQHTSGDMTRDMTRNAFDLSTNGNDNVLKKYMIERGITEEDIAGMRKTDIIRKIVQSKFTWMPTKKSRKPKQKNLCYATVSKNTDYIASPSVSPRQKDFPSATVPKSFGRKYDTESFRQENEEFPQSPQVRQASAKPPLSNFALIASKFTDPSEFPEPDEIYKNNTIYEGSYGHEQNMTYNSLAPASQKVMQAPPPPSTIVVKAQLHSTQQNIKEKQKRNETPPSYMTIKSPNSHSYESLYFDSEEIQQTTQRNWTSKPVQTPTVAPSVNTFLYSKSNESLYTEPVPITLNKTSEKTRSKTSAPLPLHMPPTLSNKNSSKSNESLYTECEPVVTNIRSNQAKPKKSGASIPPPPPPPLPPVMHSTKAIGTESSESFYVETEPLPHSSQSRETKRAEAVPPPPPPPPMAPMAPMPPPPPPPTMKSSNNGNNNNNNTKQLASAGDNGDGRDALMNSIRQGIKLKKVDQKAATISGVKPTPPRQQQKPVDFLSELKMGITLRTRIKNPADNPFAAEEENNESHA